MSPLSYVNSTLVRKNSLKISGVCSLHNSTLRSRGERSERLGAQGHHIGAHGCSKGILSSCALGTTESGVVLGMLPVESRDYLTCIPNLLLFIEIEAIKSTD
jgi:hypothetical protein